MSVIRRLWQRLSNPTYLAGKDLEGNRFYEYPSVSDDPRRTKRVVKYKHFHHMWDYVSKGRHLPVQWTAWLTHTRLHPPSLEELHADMERQRRVQLNAAMIEARDREERALQIAASRRDAPTGHSNTPQTVTPPNDSKSHSMASSPEPQYEGASPPAGSHNTEKSSRDQPKPAPKMSDEPQAWKPQTVRRGGG